MKRQAIQFHIVVWGISIVYNTDILPRFQMLTAYLHTKKSPPYVLNLDPAVHNVPYPTNVDIRDTVKYKEVMKQHGLGPNGAIMTSLNLFATKFDQVSHFKIISLSSLGLPWQWKRLEIVYQGRYNGVPSSAQVISVVYGVVHSTLHCYIGIFSPFPFPQHEYLLEVGKFQPNFDMIIKSCSN